MTEWYYVKSGASTGPITEGELHSLITSREIPLDTMVWNAALKDWVVFKEVFPDVRIDATESTEAKQHLHEEGKGFLSKLNFVPISNKYLFLFAIIFGAYKLGPPLVSHFKDEFSILSDPAVDDGRRAAALMCIMKNPGRYNDAAIKSVIKLDEYTPLKVLEAIGRDMVALSDKKRSPEDEVKFSQTFISTPCI